MASFYNEEVATLSTSTKQKLLRWAFLLLAFFLSRVWILQHPPLYYSDVKHDYERYANQWRYGLTPYREILFEYPPVDIPVLSLPLELDQRGIGKYYINYRVEIFVFETVLYVALAYAIFRLKTSSVIQWGAVAFYLLAGIVAKDFWYEGLDLLFFGMFGLMIVWMWAADQRSFVKRVGTYVLFWLSVGIKIMTGPLLLPLFLFKKLPWKKELAACVLGAALVWGIPAALYRSSLSVFVVFHANRPLKYGAFGTYIIEVINDITHTEHRVNLVPDFPMAGPVSQKVTTVFVKLFPISLAVYALGTFFVLKKSRNMSKNKEMQVFSALSLVYIFVVFITGKTFSSPFHIWYVPLLMIYPFRSAKTQWFAYALALLMLGLDTTPYLTVPKDIMVGSFPLVRFRDALRFLPMFILGGVFLHDLMVSSVKRKS